MLVELTVQHETVHARLYLGLHKYFKYRYKIVLQTIFSLSHFSIGQVSLHFSSGQYKQMSRHQN